jgi:hypothetical protein
MKKHDNESTLEFWRLMAGIWESAANSEKMLREIHERDAAIKAAK